MLVQLAIKNFVLVEQLTIDWHRGLTAITGETGAGKSILLNALLLTLGERASPSTIRHGCDQAEVTSIFSIQGKPQAKQWLAELHGELYLEQECILRRLVNRSGNSRAWINGIAVTLRQLRQLAEMLIDIHSQHEHQSLLQPATQCRLLDDYGNYKPLLAEVSSHWQQWQQAVAELEDVSQQGGEEELAELATSISELAALNLNASDYTDLSREQAELGRHTDLQQLWAQLSQQCDQAEEANLQTLINQMAKQCSEQPHLPDTLQKAAALIDQLAIINSELSSQLRHAEQTLTFNSERAGEVEERLSALFEQARRHRVSPENLYQHYCQLQQRQQQMSGQQQKISELKKQIAHHSGQYQQAARTLSQQRQQTARALSEQITACFQTLALVGSTLTIQVSPKDAGSNGVDSVSFLFSANQQPHQPLSRIASGGELSRVSLAINAVVAKTAAMPTLIFDEVDSGVGGKTADSVGELLHAISQHVQVICITHLAQVASLAHRQIKVNKEGANVALQALNHSQRVAEIARMVGGSKGGQSAEQLAETMLSKHSEQS